MKFNESLNSRLHLSDQTEGTNSFAIDLNQSRYLDESGTIGRDVGNHSPTKIRVRV